MLYVALCRVGSPECLTKLGKNVKPAMLFMMKFLISYTVALLSADLYGILRLRSVVRIIMCMYVCYLYFFR